MATKNYFSLLLLLVSAVLLNTQSCNNPPKGNALQQVEVNSDFASAPPIASNISVSLLEKPTDEGNVLFEARMAKEKIGSENLAIMVADSDKVVLHDDGKNGDKAAGDGIYSIILNENENHVKAFVQAKNQNINKLFGNKGPRFTYKGRVAVAVNDCTMVNLKRNFDFKFPGSLLDVARRPMIETVSADLIHNSLMVTDPQVVNDPIRTFDPCSGKGTAGGAWTFGRLITEMANEPLTGVSPEKFLLQFLETWKSPHANNGDDIPARPNIDRIINEWKSLSGGADEKLDVNKAPFKLLAIVNRIDLKNNEGYGGGNAGEGRFVFCYTEKCDPQRFLVIFEYGVNKTTCTAIHNYAKQWADLAAIPIGTDAYKESLQKITDQFALRNTNMRKPNQNSLNQLRTNELALEASPWELREFNIDKSTHLLVNVTTKREPQIPYNSQGGAADGGKVEAFGKFVNANEATVIADKMDIPEKITVSGVETGFLGMKAWTQDASNFHWDANVTPGTPGFITNDTARFHISLNTCSGCHGGEANTGNFTHVGLPVTATGAKLSKFLTGDPAFSGTPFKVDDRAHRPSAAAPIKWEFNDLDRRGKFLLDLLAEPCLPGRPDLVKLNERDFPFIPPISVRLADILTFDPLTMPH